MNTIPDQSLLRVTMQNDIVTLRPISPDDEDALFAAASDPAIWEQHPDRERYKPEVFRTFFDGAIAAPAGFVVLDSASGDIIGSSRYYYLTHDEHERYSAVSANLAIAVCIGYTFLTVACWGGRYNSAMKELMLRHAFRYVDTVVFQVGAGNIRSRTAVGRLGATQLPLSHELPDDSDTSKLHVVFELTKAAWLAQGNVE